MGIAQPINPKEIQPINPKEIQPINPKEIQPMPHQDSFIRNIDRASILSSIRTSLNKIEVAPGKIQRDEIALDLFRRLNTPEGIQFLIKEKKFQKVCLKKFTELSQQFEGTQLSLFRKISQEINSRLKEHQSTQLVNS